MKDGLVKIAAAAPSLRVADTQYNADQIISCISDADALGVKILTFPELSITGCTCRDLFRHEVLLKGAEEALCRIIEATVGLDMLVFVGLPFADGSKLYSCAAAICSGYLLGLVPKKNVFGSFFSVPDESPHTVEIGGLYSAVLSPDILFRHEKLHSLCVAAELGEDIASPHSPAVRHALAGATVIARLASFPETLFSTEESLRCICADTKRLTCTIVLAAPGRGESSTDNVYSGLCALAENGSLLDLDENDLGIAVSETDTAYLQHLRLQLGYFAESKNSITLYFGAVS